MTSARILLASGGPTYAHDHASTASVLAELLTNAGHLIEGVTTHPDEIPAAIERVAPDCIVSHMLWWQMLAERYDDLRSTWAYESSAALRAAIERFVVDGGALVALHTSTICFDDWPGWGDLLGAQWNWNRSFHPPLGAVSVRLVSLDAGTPADPETEARSKATGAPVDGTTEWTQVVGGLVDYETVDEVYMHLDVRTDAKPLAFARPVGDPLAAEHPVLWCRSVGRGAVATFGLGHDASALSHPTTAELVRRCVAWTVRSTRASSGY